MTIPMQIFSGMKWVILPMIKLDGLHFPKNLHRQSKQIPIGTIQITKEEEQTYRKCCQICNHPLLIIAIIIPTYYQGCSRIMIW